MKIIDCFIFYNELDILFYRISTLYPIIDYFILVESKYTFVGKKKDLYYDENKQKFEQFKDKIIHIIVEECPFKYPNIDFSKRQQWTNEFYQRDCIKIGIDKLDLKNEDILVISDVDEITDIDLLKAVKNKDRIIDDLYSLAQDCYYYNLNTLNSTYFCFSKILSFEVYKNMNISINDIRSTHTHKKTILRGGWHLSYFGDINFIKNKLENFSHQEYNNNNYNNDDYIRKNLENQIDLFGRNDQSFIKISIKNNTYLPHQYEKFLNKYILY